METKPLNRIKADKLALEEKTIQAIEHLTDEEIAEFLHQKWIVPVCQGINGSLTAVLSALETAALPSARNMPSAISILTTRLPKLTKSSPCW